MGDAFGSAATRRWKLRSNATAESGANAGSDFQIVRHDDAGVALDAPLEITRSTGQVVFAGSGGVIATRGSLPLTVKSTNAAGQTVLIEGQGAASVALSVQATGDGLNRFRAYIDGKLEWGDGVAGRDTNLYRSAVDTLKTDDSFHVGQTLRHLGTSLGFYSKTPVSQAAAIAGPIDGLTIDVEARTAINSILAALRGVGLIAT